MNNFSCTELIAWHYVVTVRLQPDNYTDNYTDTTHNLTTNISTNCIMATPPAMTCAFWPGKDFYR